MGDYEILSRLGAGGMGSVYKVRNVISDRVEAMKILLPDLCASPELAERFLHEIKVLASLQHPNIASLHTALRVNNQLLMVMELVDGHNLEEHLARGPLPLGVAVGLIRQAAGALAYAHLQGVVHRDIKPANIAIDRQGQVKLIDFGIARAGERKLTMTGVVMGSLYYMPPEQVQGGVPDARSDLYSLGATLYRTLTGRRPFEGANEYALMQAQIGETPVAPHLWNGAVPEALSAIVLRAMEKEPGRRFQTAEEFRQALAGFERAGGETLVLAGARVGAGTAGGTPVPASTRFDSVVLTMLQGKLAVTLGPIAGAVVRKCAREAEDLPQLVRLLAGQVESEGERQRFLAACAAALPAVAGSELAHAVPVPPAAMAPAMNAVALSPELLEGVRRRLAVYLGPLARVIVERAAKKATSLEQLYQLVAAEINSPAERQEFLMGERKK